MLTVRTKVALWVKPQEAAQYLADPSFIEVLTITSEQANWPKHYGYILLGLVDIDYSVDDKPLREMAIKEIDKKIVDLGVKLAAEVADLERSKQNLLALTYEG